MSPASGRRRAAELPGTGLPTTSGPVAVVVAPTARATLDEAAVVRPPQGTREDVGART